MRYLCFFYQLPLFYEGIWPCSGIWIKKGNLTYQMVRRLEKSGELSKETVFIDGTKLEACFNKYTFVWKKSVGKLGSKDVWADSGSSPSPEPGACQDPKWTDREPSV